MIMVCLGVLIWSVFGMCAICWVRGGEAVDSGEVRDVGSAGSSKWRKELEGTLLRHSLYWAGVMGWLFAVFC